MGDLLDLLKRESEVILRAPFAFSVFVVFGFVIGYVVATWYLTGQIAARDGLIAERDGKISRYRQALRLDEPGANALVELTNAELRTKALALVSELRDFEVGTRNATDVMLSGAKNDLDKAERLNIVSNRRGDEFNRQYRAESVNIDHELRRRLGPKAVASIVGIAPSVFDAGNGAAVSVATIVGGLPGFSASFVSWTADGIEQMARLLPADK